jgi:hypothetical protein
MHVEHLGCKRDRAGVIDSTSATVAEPSGA